MLKIDAHQHFWNYEPVRDAWINEEMQVLRQDFLPLQLEPLLNAHGFHGSVVVQSAQEVVENDYQLYHCSHHPFIKGVVGWVDFDAEGYEALLEKYSVIEKMKGFRHILQGEQDRAAMLRPAFKQGIGRLRQHGFSYDLLLQPDQLGFAETLMREFPDQPFVLDHLGKPDIKNGHIADWEKQVRALAQHEQVYCKVSGMVTEADLQHWEARDFRPYLDVVFDSFGSERVMFGSDWPVCLLAADYAAVLGIMENYMASFSIEEQARFWGGNASRFYQLKE